MYSLPILPTHHQASSLQTNCAACALQDYHNRQTDHELRLKNNKINFKAKFIVDDGDDGYVCLVWSIFRFYTCLHFGFD